MHIEVIVRVHGAQASPQGYESPSVQEVKIGEAVAPDPALPLTGFGEPLYGFPLPKHPWARAYAVLDFLGAAAKVRGREKLEELASDDRDRLAREIDRWIQKNPGSLGTALADDPSVEHELERIFPGIEQVLSILREHRAKSVDEGFGIEAGPGEADVPPADAAGGPGSRVERLQAAPEDGEGPRSEGDTEFRTL